MKLMTKTLSALLLLVGMQAGTLTYAHAQPRNIEIRAHRFSFEPSEITIKRGETVKLELTSDDVTHALVIPDLKVNQEIKKGKTVEVTITPDSAGDFHGQCGHFCGSGHGSMLFVVHVTE